MDDEIAEWVKRSREAQGLPETITDADTLAALANLVRMAQDTENIRRRAA